MERHAPGLHGSPSSAMMRTPHLVRTPIDTSSPLSATPHFWILKPKTKESLAAGLSGPPSAVMRSSHLVLTTIDTSSPCRRHPAFGSSVGHAS
ncbi:hypothetical protein TNCT_482951 [Trichonephila clavata]|uniref:Uncharacterized protein n=1 Tax=Trichonephila clavata TaxID=2740835 RepID=A0A8X6GC10_TRICU|nr:hypothetical protein TNCT_482951 [Trichonephila clavata]